MRDVPLASQDAVHVDAGQLPPVEAPYVPDSTPVSKRELWSWYAVDWANSVYVSVGISGFLPLLVQTAATLGAGFPAVCANAGGAASTYFAGGPAYYLPFAPLACEGGSECVPASSPGDAWGGGDTVVCPGVVPTTDRCLSLTGGVWSRQPLAVDVYGGSFDPTAFATGAITASVILQLLVLVFLGALADFGSARKRAILTCSVLGGALCVACLGVGPTAVWLGGALLVFSNICIGLQSALSNAYLPLLVNSLPSVAALRRGGASSSVLVDAEETASSGMSARGFAAGYAAGFIALILLLPLMLHASSELSAYQGALVFSGVWWVVFSVPVAVWLRPRPGPPLPPGTSLVRASLASVGATASSAVALPVTGFFLLIWMVGSDAIFTLGSLAGLYANSEVVWSCGLSKTTGITVMFLLTPACAGLGNFAYLKLGARYRISPLRCLLFSMACLSLIPAYGLLGFVSDSVGLRSGPEMIVAAAWYGLHVGAYQALSRSLFSALIPPGRSAAFFAAYELTNRGSSAIGPLVLTAVQQSTGELRYAFWFVLITTVLPAVGLAFLDLPRGRAEALQYGAPAVSPASSKTPTAATAVAQVVEPPYLPWPSEVAAADSSHLTAGAVPEAATAPLHPRAIVAGTFDVLHAGHASLLHTAFRHGQHVEVWVTSDALSAAKGARLGQTISGYGERVASVSGWCDAHGYAGRFSVHPLHDGVGASVEDPTYTVIVCSEESVAGCAVVNAARTGKGWPPLEVVVAPLVVGADGVKVSSSDIRAGRGGRGVSEKNL